MPNRTPLALFVYNRPAHTRRALEAISRLQRLDEVDLIVFCDAARRPEHQPAVAETRGIVRAHAASHRVEIVERDTNFGLAKSIAGSTSVLTDAYGSVIVLEDDLVPTPDFLPYMLDGLERYREAESVLQISGCLLPGTVTSPADTLFLPLTTTWGWATWKRAWKAFQPVTTADRTALNEDASLRHRFTAEGAVDYVSMLDDRLADRNDSWGILWWFAVARAQGLVLYPRKSLIWNGGFDASGVHCGGTEVFQEQAPAVFHRARLGTPISMPGSVSCDTEAWGEVLRFLANGDVRADAAPPVSRIRAFARRLLSRA